MENDAVIQAGRYLLHLIDCGLHGAAAQPIPEGVSWQQVHALAALSSVEGVSWFGAKTRDDVPVDLRKQWENEAQMTLFRRLRFDAEREQVFAALAEAGLSYLPLKGTLLANYYPRPEMRSMADNDFLYGFVEPAPDGGFRICGQTESEREAATERGIRTIVSVMKARGYKTVSKGVGNHESFHKPPIFNFEPHRRLMAPAHQLAPYFESPWRRAIRDEADPYLFRFSDEDEYVYVIAHAFKHFENAGCGIRFVVDVRVFLDAKGLGMDWDRTFAELQKAGLFEFEAQVRELADAAFGGSCSLAPLPADMDELLRFLLVSGTYGNNVRAVERRLEKQLERHDGDLKAAKRGYLRERLLNDEAITAIFPRASKVKPLRPVLQLARYARGFVRNPKKLTNEIKQLIKAK